MGFHQYHEPADARKMDRIRPERSHAHFAQRVGATAGAIGDACSNASVMSSERLIVDLADRHGDGLDVVLTWARRSGRFWVTVTHRRSGRTVKIEATPTNALDVFNHPFAHTRAGAR